MEPQVAVQLTRFASELRAISKLRISVLIDETFGTVIRKGGTYDGATAV